LLALQIKVQRSQVFVIGVYIKASDREDIIESLDSLIKRIRVAYEEPEISS
jgi:glycine cleavage system regulatory protein